MKRLFAGLAASVVVAYPLSAATLFIADFLFGERLVTFYVLFEQRLLWDTFWADYFASLPVFAGMVGLLVVGYVGVRGLRGPVTPWMVVPIGVVLGWGAAIYLTGTPFGLTHLSLMAAGALVGALVAASLAAVVIPSSNEDES